MYFWYTLLQNIKIYYRHHSVDAQQKPAQWKSKPNEIKSFVILPISVNKAIDVIILLLGDNRCNANRHPAAKKKLCVSFIYYRTISIWFHLIEDQLMFNMIALPESYLQNLEKNSIKLVQAFAIALKLSSNTQPHIKRRKMCCRIVKCI